MNHTAIVVLWKQIPSHSTAWGLGEGVSTFIPWWSVSDRKNIMTKLLGARFCQLLSLIPVLSNYVGFRSSVSENTSQIWCLPCLETNIRIMISKFPQERHTDEVAYITCRSKHFKKIPLIRKGRICILLMVEFTCGH